MSVVALLHRFAERESQTAVIHGQQTHTYGQLLEVVNGFRQQVRQLIDGYPELESHTIAIQGDYSVRTVAAILATIAEGRVACLISPDTKQLPQLLHDANAGWFWCPDAQSSPESLAHPSTPVSPLLIEMSDDGVGGFVVFTSGATGAPKAVLHDFDRFSGHLIHANKAKVTLAFLLLDHIAGMDTLLYTLFAGGSLVVPASRGCADVLRAIDSHSVQVLPTSPSFLRLVVLDGNTDQCNLDSLQIITYGSEPLSESALAVLKSMFTSVRFVQKYGTSEFGSPRTQTRQSEETWLKLDSDHLSARVENDILWVRTDTVMRGYLNAPQPEIRDGWLCTGDRVELDNGWYRILGRESEMINVGGEKVFPSEVEGVIEQLDQIDEAIVRGEPHPILGNIVAATVCLNQPVENVRRLVRTHCSKALQAFKVPMKVQVSEQALHSERHKKLRREV